MYRRWYVVDCIFEIIGSIIKIIYSWYGFITQLLSINNGLQKSGFTYYLEYFMVFVYIGGFWANFGRFIYGTYNLNLYSDGPDYINVKYYSLPDF